ncbi:MarR family winged helix-turn-helix transcriptional regulator [Hydrogenophaga sp. PAMC20947]|uniref:MarR family winged helix-turn-helix transcriptional regulator n=1 Tax=Hydrogenophaga sp. PAMC20947 TaxID=2565558 RepID=UPI00109DA811|nr:MarR family winged helix-turn-helix transcriptional regulator [Hydrogenophaga sp. PAMC20947]QCB46599.1 MarR family transcriptional regulator [Hydrogenophaga sp. PAMC20947]
MPKQGFAFHAHLHSGHLLEEHLRSRLTGLGISPRQARVLDAMDRMGPVSQVALARAFNLTAASMSTMSSRLIEAGLIDKVRNPDSTRGNLLTLSARGCDALGKVYEAWADMDRLMDALLGQPKAHQLAALTRELRDALGGQPPGPPVD